MSIIRRARNALCRTASLLALLLMVPALTGLPPDAQATKATVSPRAVAEILVTTTADEWGTGSGCSLREAIHAADCDTAYGGCPAGSGNDTIRLPVGTYTLSRSGANEDGNETGDLDIASNVVIMGEGQDTTIIDGGGLDRVLQVHSGSVRLYNLTVRGGQAPHGSDGFHGFSAGDSGGPGGSGQDGGGIYNAGSLKLELVTVQGNKAGNGGRGGDGQTGTAGSGGPGGDGGNGGSGGICGGVFNDSASVLWPRGSRCATIRPAMGAQAAMGEMAVMATATMAADEAAMALWTLTATIWWKSRPTARCRGTAALRCLTRTPNWVNWQPTAARPSPTCPSSAARS